MSQKAIAVLCAGGLCMCSPPCCVRAAHVGTYVRVCARTAAACVAARVFMPRTCLFAECITACVSMTGAVPSWPPGHATLVPLRHTQSDTCETLTWSVAFTSSRALGTALLVSPPPPPPPHLPSLPFCISSHILSFSGSLSCGFSSSSSSLSSAE